jgi:hypothetical protein
MVNIHFLDLKGLRDSKKLNDAKTYMVCHGLPVMPSKKYGFNTKLEGEGNQLNSH